MHEPTCTIFFVLFLAATTYYNNYFNLFIHHISHTKKGQNEVPKKVLNIHIVPHTHDDVGWLKTVDQYYYGRNNSIQHACVSCILDSVIYALKSDPQRKFTYVEMAFFSMWWEEQTTEIKQIVKELVQNGQLSFANGGWCMHDEATTHYMGMIDQTSLGHDFLKRELDFVPTVAWQLDPFGHSSTQSSLLGSVAGFDAIYFGRIDYQDLQQRHLTRNCEGIWDSSPNLNETAIFWGLTGSYSGNYGAPDGFCFDVLCDNEPLIGLDRNQLHSRVKDFLNDIKLQADRTRGNHVMLTMGSDFQYQNAMVNFKNLDLLIITINNWENISSLFSDYDEVQAFYSTPEIYTEKKYEEYINPNNFNDSKIEYEIKRDDFFPYSDCDHCFWTGYFTSRPGLKRLERVGSSFLQISRQIQAFFLDDEVVIGEIKGTKRILELEKAMGIVQHHDGVSGTSKQHVAYDYAKKVQFGINEAASFVEDAMKNIFQTEDGVKFENVAYCQLRNESICELSQDATLDDSGHLYVILYNALAQPRNDFISLPVSSHAHYTVERSIKGLRQDFTTYNDNWQFAESSLLPNHFEGKKSSQFILVFEAHAIEPISMTLFRITKNNVSKEDEVEIDDKHSLRSPVVTNDSRSLHDQSFMVDNDEIEVHFDNCGLNRIFNKKLGLNASVRFEWGYYKSFDGRNHTQASGAYIFRPEVPNDDMTKITPVPSKTQIIPTSLLTEVHLKYEVSWLSTVVKIFKGKPYIDIDYIVGPINIDDGVGKEVVTRFYSDIKNKGFFYSDSNGREFVKRVRSKRSWNLQEFEPVAGNFYPVNTALYIEDDVASMSLLTDRSQGGSSLIDGTVELMVQRRIIHDDGRGVGEPMNETDSGMMPYPPYGDASRIGEGVKITGTHRLLYGLGKSGASLARSEMDNIFSPIHVFAATTSSSPDMEFFFMKKSASAIQKKLPSNIQLTTIKVLSVDQQTTTFLIRLSHGYGRGESDLLSSPVLINLADLFLYFEILSVKEKTLTGNRDLSEWLDTKMKWQNDLNSNHADIINGRYAIMINPMEIRTFEVQVQNAG